MKHDFALTQQYLKTLLKLSTFLSLSSSFDWAHTSCLCRTPMSPQGRVGWLHTWSSSTKRPAPAATFYKAKRLDEDCSWVLGSPPSADTGHRHQGTRQPQPEVTAETLSCKSGPLFLQLARLYFQKAFTDWECNGVSTIHADVGTHCLSSASCWRKIIELTRPQTFTEVYWIGHMLGERSVEDWAKKTAQNPEKAFLKHNGHHLQSLAHCPDISSK